MLRAQLALHEPAYFIKADPREQTLGFNRLAKFERHAGGRRLVLFGFRKNPALHLGRLNLVPHTTKKGTFLFFAAAKNRNVPFFVKS